MDHWLAQLLDGLAEFDAYHPKLYYETGAAPGQKIPADCPCHLLRDVPDKVMAEARAYMDGWRAGQKASPTCTCVVVTPMGDAPIRIKSGTCPIHADRDNGSAT